MITCSHCGSENNMDKINCVECGNLLINEFVICTVCGQSNNATDDICKSCLEKLDKSKKYSIKNKEEEEVEALLSSESQVVVKDTNIKKKKEKNIINFRPIILIMIMIFLVVMMSFWAVSYLNSTKAYISSDDGFYYITDSDELHIINHLGDDYNMLTNISDNLKVHLYGNRGFILNGHELYSFKESETFKIASNVNSYKVNISGDRLLYTSSVTSPTEGDLFLFDGELNTMVDAKVEVNRYSFGKASDIYYVTDVTSEESLGTLFIKQGKRAAVEMAQDVYMPLFSKRKGSVYFTRVNINKTESFNLLYSNGKRVTEIARNAKNIFLTPGFEEIIIIQNKNGAFNVIKNKRENIETLGKGILEVGLYDFESQLDKIQYLDSKAKEIFFISSGERISYTSLGKTELTEITASFTKFNYSRKGNILYYYMNDELSKGLFNKGNIEDSMSIASHVTVTSISNSGETIVFNNSDNTSYLLDANNSIKLDNDLKYVLVSDNDKYVVYLKSNNNLYALKVGAKKDILINSDVNEIILLDKSVYSVSDGNLEYYKLGKYSSNKLINRIIRIGYFE